MTDPFEQVIREVEARQLRHAQLSQTAAEKTMQWACTTAAIEADDILSILRRHQQAWREANAAQPAPASVADAMRARGWVRHADVPWMKTINGRSYQIANYRAEDLWDAFHEDAEDSTLLTPAGLDLLAAADACERHAKENAK